MNIDNTILKCFDEVEDGLSYIGKIIEEVSALKAPNDVRERIAEHVMGAVSHINTYKVLRDMIKDELESKNKEIENKDGNKN